MPNRGVPSVIIDGNYKFQDIAYEARGKGEQLVRCREGVGSMSADSRRRFALESL
jgi:hypothetical protein